MIRSLPDLRSLTIVDNFDILDYHNFFPELEYFCLSSEDMLYDELKLNQFVAKHITSQGIILIDTNNISTTICIFKRIVENVKNLRKLVFKCNHVEHLLGLTMITAF